MKTLVHSIAAVLLAVALFLPPLSVQADIAPPPPPTGTTISPGEEQTQVRMVSEEVVIDVALNSPYENGHAFVTASFLMHNLGSSDEQMQVRFPLCAGDRDLGYGLFACRNYQPIHDFQVRVNGTQAVVTYTLEKVEKEDFQMAQLPTWAHFPVVFPVGKDVIIEVQYTQLGYDRMGPYYPEFNYVLETGAAWKDTIGTADITLRIPMQVDEVTVISHEPRSDYLSPPSSVSFVENEIRWHLEDIDPYDEIGVVSVKILQPYLWQKIETEWENVRKRPEDGEGWGRLARAYKMAATVEKGRLRYDEAGELLYWESFDAYQKAVDLVPNDADWHYGFAELLDANLGFNNYRREGETETTLLVQCVQQVHDALAINPNHPGALELLLYLQQPGVIDLSGPQPDYLILTSLPPTDTPEPTHTFASILPTNTTPPTLTQTLTSLPVRVTTAVDLSQTPSAKKPERIGVCGSALIPAMSVVALFRKGSQKKSL